MMLFKHTISASYNHSPKLKPNVVLPPETLGRAEWVPVYQRSPNLSRQRT